MFLETVTGLHCSGLRDLLNQTWAFPVFRVPTLCPDMEVKLPIYSSFIECDIRLSWKSGHVTLLPPCQNRGFLDKLCYFSVASHAQY
jgi:hypothetical protein